MEHADDHFLADVAPLRQADRARLDSRFERNRLRIHIEIELRYAGFDANRLGGLRVGSGNAGTRERLAEGVRLRLLDVHVVSGFAGIRDARHDRRAATELRPAIAMLRQHADLARRAPEDPADDTRRVRPDDGDGEE